MAVGGLFKFAQRALFSKPTPERQLLKLAQSRPVRRIVEIGVDSLDASQKLIDAVVKRSQGEPVAYTAIDQFEQRPQDVEPLTLAAAYQRLSPLGARVRFLPGAVEPALRAEANSLADTDLLLLSRDAIGAERCWFYLPRMCHPGTLVCQRHDGETADDPGGWRQLELQAVAELAASPARLAA